MHATGNGHRSGEEWRSASEKSVLSRLPDNRGNWRSIGGPGLHPREDDKVVVAARRREQGRKRQAIPAGLTGSGGHTRRSQVRVPMHHGPGLSEDQCQREQHAEPRGIPVLGQGPGLCHPHSIAWMSGRSRIHRRRTREPGIGSAVTDSIGSLRGRPGEVVRFAVPPVEIDYIAHYRPRLHANHNPGSRGDSRTSTDGGERLQRESAARRNLARPF
jgi:hypothetical protein